MKKTRVLLIVLVALFVGFLTACTSTEDLLKAAKDELVAEYTDTISSETYQVTGNLTLVDKIGDATISWTSSNTAIITTAGVVTRPEADTVVTLTATITIDGETVTHQFRVTVKAVEVTDAQRVQAAKDLLVAQYANTIGDDEYVVSGNLSLVTTIGEATVSWATSDAAIITSAGVVSVPSHTVGDQTVTLTATLTVGSETQTQLFYAFVEAADETVAERLDRVLVFATTFPAVEGVTGVEEWLVFSDSVTFENQTYTVVWTSDKPDSLDVDGTVTRPAVNTPNVTVTMTASITEGSVTRTIEKEFVVFAIESSKLLASIADIYDEEKGAYVKFEGVTVIGKMSGGFFISDGTTILYIYDNTTLYNTVQIGSVYDIEGVYDIYYSAPQLTNDASRPLTSVASSATPASLNGTTSTVEGAITGKLTPSGDNLMVFDYLSITGKIIVDAQETVDVGRYNTFLVSSAYEGTKVIKTLASGKAAEYETPAIVIYYQSPNKAAVEALSGKEVTINILLYGWRTDRNIWYAVYLGDGTDIEVAFESDTDAVAAVKSSLELPGSVVEATTLELITSKFGATVEWDSTNEAVINPTTGVVTPIDGEQVTVTLTANIEKGLITDTKTFEIKVGVPSLSTIAAAKALADGATIKVKGILTGVTKTSTGGNTYWIQDATGGMNVYANVAMTAILSEAAIGAEVELVGEFEIYNGLFEITKITSAVVTNETPALPTPVSLNTNEFTADALLPFQGQLVSFEGFLLKAKVATSTSSFNFTLYNPFNGKEIPGRVEATIADFAAINTYLAGLDVNAPVNVVGAILSWYNTPQLAIIGSANLVNGALTDETKVGIDASLVTVPAAYTEAGTLTIATPGANGSVISWTSDNVLIDATTGAVSMPASGQETVTITVLVKLNDAEKSVEFEVLVGTADAGTVLTTTMSYTGTTTGNMVALENNAASVNLDPVLFNVTATFGTGTSLVGLNKSGQIRLYGNKGDGNGNTLTIAVAAGYTITGIVITYGASTNTPTAKLTLGTNVIDLAAADITSTTGTYSSLALQQFSIQNTQKDSAATKNAQVYILSIVISYIQNPVA